MGRVSVIGSRVGTALGVLSVLLLTIFSPWRAVLCEAPDSLASPFPFAICKANMVTGHSQLATSPNAPASTYPDCPICLGLAGLVLAIAATPIFSFTLASFAFGRQFAKDPCRSGQFRLFRFSRAPPARA
jgi:hypothetical protein